MALNKETKADMKMFLDKDGRVKYNTKCKECAKSCKQSYRAQIISCTKYVNRKSSS